MVFSPALPRLLSSRVENASLLTYAAALNGAAVVAFATLFLAGYELPAPWVLVGLVAVAAIAERQSVAVTRNIRSSVSFLPFVFTAVAFGPLAAFVVAGAANISDLPDRKKYPNPYLRWAVYTPARAMTGAVVGLAAEPFDVAEGSALGAIFLASLVAALANVLVDSVFNVLTLVVRCSGTLDAYVATIGPYLGISLPLYVPLVALLVYGYWAYSLWVVAAFLGSAVAFQRLIHLYHQQREAVHDLGEANIRLARANLSFATALVATLDARDRYTAGHSAAVAIYARDIAARMGLTEKEQELAHLCGLVHDIGKIGLPPTLLEKRGPLTLQERRQMETHPEIGERILAKVEDYSEIARIVRHHHERWDRQGYPERLGCDEIPLLSRIIAVADAYNAMTSDRPYRDAMPSRVARLRLAQAVESQFDTAVVAAFEAILAGADESYRTARSADFEFEARQEPALYGGDVDAPTFVMTAAS
jgi:putative nucleotidyltransferase with HDIG domain